MQELQLDNTLLGVDAVFQQQLVGQDLSEQGILALLDQYPRARAVLSVMGGQGILLAAAISSSAHRYLSVWAKRMSV